MYCCIIVQKIVHKCLNKLQAPSSIPFFVCINEPLLPGASTGVQVQAAAAQFAAQFAAQVLRAVHRGDKHRHDTRSHPLAPEKGMSSISYWKLAMKVTSVDENSLLRNFYVDRIVIVSSISSEIFYFLLAWSTHTERSKVGSFKGVGRLCGFLVKSPSPIIPPGQFPTGQLPPKDSSPQGQLPPCISHQNKLNTYPDISPWTISTQTIPSRKIPS